MKKRIKKKRLIKEKFVYYHGLMIWQNSPYAFDMIGDKVMLSTPDIERYFDSVQKAKRFIDKFRFVKYTSNHYLDSSEITIDDFLANSLFCKELNYM